MALTAVQQAHVDGVFPEHRAQMAEYLESGVGVVIFRQKECGPDVPPFAIAVQIDPEFWIDCADTEAAAIHRAESLGLKVV